MSRVTCDGHMDLSCAVGLARGGRWAGGGNAYRKEARVSAVSTLGGVPARPCGGEHVCRQEGKSTLTSRLQIKQYLWAIVIKGKFNSVLMLNYARLCEVRLGWCRRFNGTRGYAGKNGSPGLSSFSWVSAGETGPAAVFLSALSRECLPFLLGSLWWQQGLPGQLVLMLCPLPALQEGPVPQTVGVGEGGATQEERAGRGGGPG